MQPRVKQRVDAAALALLALTRTDRITPGDCSPIFMRGLS